MGSSSSAAFRCVVSLIAWDGLLSMLTIDDCFRTRSRHSPRAAERDQAALRDESQSDAGARRIHGDTRRRRRRGLARELKVALDGGAEPGEVSIAGPGKTDAELRQAVAAGALTKVESERELDVLARRQRGI